MIADGQQQQKVGNEGPDIPRWAQDLKERIDARMSAVFVLHFNVADEVRFGDQFVSIETFLGRWLAGDGRMIAYDRSHGLRFSDQDIEALFRKVTGFTQEAEAATRRALTALGQVAPPERELPTHPTKVLSLLETAIRSGCFGAREGPALLVLVGYAETLVPDAELSSMSDDDRTNLVTFLRWAADPEILRSGVAIILTVGNLADLHAQLRGPASRVETIEIPLPTLSERAEYIQHLQAANGFTMEMSPEQLAHVTAGLSRLHLKTLCRRASGRDVTLTYSEVTERKREILKRELQGMIEVVEPTLGLNVIGGMEAVKAYLRRVVQAIRDGDHKLVPRGITLLGPPGVGKTALAEALAKECGFNFVKIVNPREKWVGQSERNYWRILQALRSMTPVVVLEDEADQSEQTRDEYSGDSGVGNRIRQMRFAFTGDPTIQGQILWIRISNRPDRLDAAEKRSGRSSERIPLLMPNSADKSRIFEVMPAKHGFPCEVTDFSAAVEHCERRHPGQISGADIEEITFRAYRRARWRGAQAIALDDYVWAIDDFIPFQDRESIEAQERAALDLCSSRQFLPEGRRDLLEARKPLPGSGAA
ncbi:MAG: ATP-binding protein [Candidatus Methylomirabilis oxyfera]|nr:ATP-binding protein [Candidatus Methylomirabilis oxyfera]